jgi:putative nucleotidyltransferase with HDIG domain
LLVRSLVVGSLRPEMVVGHHIYSANGTILLARGVPLTADLISRLTEIGIRHVMIDDAETEGIEPRDAVPPDVRVRAVSSVQETFNRVSSQLSVSSTRIEGNAFRSIAADILDGLREQPGNVYNIISVKTYDEYTYQHSVNVAVLAMIIGRTLKLPEDRLLTLGVGALLHDLGKTQIPLSVLNKPGRLTPDEFDVIKHHARSGFDILKANSCISPLSVNVALRHHERPDGSGYPDGYKRDRIHQFAKIVAAADVYDALTSVRVYRDPMVPDAAMRYLVSESPRHLDVQAVRGLSTSISPYPVGCGVLLSNGYAGIVCAPGVRDALRPSVRLIYAPGGEPLSPPEEINLAASPSLLVREVTEDAGSESLKKLASVRVAA